MSSIGGSDSQEGMTTVAPTDEGYGTAPTSPTSTAASRCLRYLRGGGMKRPKVDLGWNGDRLGESAQGSSHPFEAPFRTNNPGALSSSHPFVRKLTGRGFVYMRDGRVAAYDRRLTGRSSAIDIWQSVDATEPMLQLSRTFKCDQGKEWDLGEINELMELADGRIAAAGVAKEPFKPGVQAIVLFPVPAMRQHGGTTSHRMGVSRALNAVGGAVSSNAITGAIAGGARRLGEIEGSIAAVGDAVIQSNAITGAVAGGARRLAENAGSVAGAGVGGARRLAENAGSMAGSTITGVVMAAAGSWAEEGQGGAGTTKEGHTAGDQVAQVILLNQSGDLLPSFVTFSKIPVPGSQYFDDTRMFGLADGNLVTLTHRKDNQRFVEIWDFSAGGNGRVTASRRLEDNEVLSFFLELPDGRLVTVSRAKKGDLVDALIKIWDKSNDKPTTIKSIIEDATNKKQKLGVTKQMSLSASQFMSTMKDNKEEDERKKEVGLDKRQLMYTINLLKGGKQLAWGQGRHVVIATIPGPGVKNENTDKPVELKGHTEAIRNLVELKGARLASVAGAVVRIWNVPGVNESASLESFVEYSGQGIFQCLIELSDGRLAFSEYSGKIDVWNSANEEKNLELRGHTYSGGYDLARSGVVVAEGAVSCMVELSDGRLASAGMSDGTVRIWDIKESSIGKREAMYTLHQDSVAFENLQSPNDRWNGLAQLDDNRIVARTGINYITFNLPKLEMAYDHKLLFHGKESSANDIKMALKSFMLNKESGGVDMLGHLLESATRVLICEKAPALNSAAQLMHAIEHMVVEEEDQDRVDYLVERIARCVQTLSADKWLFKFIILNIGDDSITSSLEKSALLRSIIATQFQSGPRILYGIESVVFLLFMFLYLRRVFYNKAIYEQQPYYDYVEVCCYALLAFRCSSEVLSTWFWEVKDETGEIKTFIYSLSTLLIVALGIEIALVFAGTVPFMCGIAVFILIYPLIYYSFPFVAWLVSPQSHLAVAEPELRPQKTYRKLRLALFVSETWGSEPWNYVDVGVLLATGHSMISARHDNDTSMIIAVVFLWLKLLCQLKTTYLSYATFIHVSGSTEAGAASSPPIPSVLRAKRSPNLRSPRTLYACSKCNR